VETPAVQHDLFELERLVDEPAVGGDVVAHSGDVLVEEDDLTGARRR
jgi:hypothetical protein